MGSKATTTNFKFWPRFKFFFGFTAPSVCGKEPKTIEIRGQLRKKFNFFRSSYVTYPDGFALCKKRDRKILTLNSHTWAPLTPIK